MIKTHGKPGRLPANSDLLRRNSGCVHFEFEHHQTYLTPDTIVSLHVLLLNDDSTCQCLITTTNLRSHIDAAAASEAELFHKIAAMLNQQPINLNQPMQLEPVFIAKPWGQEIWYSGIESRGISTVKSVPIAWIFDIFGEFLGCTTQPLLLKILDPSPVTNLGDLYFELHEEKVEVYIATHVDPAAWPDGEGKIRYGFNQSLLKSFETEDDFLSAYLSCVKEYENVRRVIDDQLRQLKAQKGIDLEPTQDPVLNQQLLTEIDDELTASEAHLREAMYAFTTLVPVKAGDVITVAPFVPHSLQHGVRVVEFQTPHYERHILSFGQEVLTQDHWDTTDAISQAILTAENPRPPRELGKGQDLVADFDAFRVLRLTLSAGDVLERSHAGYVILIGVSGQVNVVSGAESAAVTAEVAWYLAPEEGVIRFENSSSGPAILLLAEEPDRISP